VTPGHAGFVLSEEQRTVIHKSDPQSDAVIFPYVIGDELLTGDGGPERFLIDFQPMSIVEAETRKKAFARVKETVLPDRQAKAEEGKDSSGKMRSHHRQFLERWWRLSWERRDMHEALAKLPGMRCVACSRVTKRPVFVFVSTQMRLGDRLQIFAFDDDYSFGVLQSSPHWQWFTTKCSKLTERFIYTPDTVFDTFPWPQSPTAAQIEAVAAAAVEVRRVRGEALKLTTGGLRAVYRTLELPGKHPLKDAHAALDTAVLAAYGFDANKDLLAQLLELNLTVAAMEKQNKKVTAPGVPANYPGAKKLVTDDCIRP
jgi:hypothetical protein